MWLNVTVSVLHRACWTWRCALTASCRNLSVSTGSLNRPSLETLSTFWTSTPDHPSTSHSSLMTSWRKESKEYVYHKSILFVCSIRLFHLTVYYLLSCMISCLSAWFRSQKIDNEPVSWFMSSQSIMLKQSIYWTTSQKSMHMLIFIKINYACSA